MPTTIWNNGKPIATDNQDEAKRMNDKIVVIDRVLKEMGYTKGYDEYTTAINDMVSKDFNKYMDFLKRVNQT